MSLKIRSFFHYANLHPPNLDGTNFEQTIDRLSLSSEMDVDWLPLRRGRLAELSTQSQNDHPDAVSSISREQSGDR